MKSFQGLSMSVILGLCLCFSLPAAFADVALPAPGQTLVCNSTEVPAGEFPSSVMHIQNTGNGYTIAEFNRRVVMKVKSNSGSQVVLSGKKFMDITESLFASVSVKSDGTGSATLGISGWNPESTVYELSGCQIQ